MDYGVCKVLEERIRTKIVIGGLALKCSHNPLWGHRTEWGGHEKSDNSARIFEKARMET